MPARSSAGNLEGVRLRSPAAWTTIGGMDWGDGEYEHTAKELFPAAEVAIDAVAPSASERALDIRLLDVGCGTGNAALVAARRGARVTAVDPAARLLDEAGRRARDEDLRIETVRGDATALPFGDGSFDAAVSVFALIFAEDAQAAAAEIVRVVRPGGRVVVTSWLPTGAVSDIGRMVRDAAAAANPELGNRPAATWGDPDFVRRTFSKSGAVAITEHAVAIQKPSPEAWLDELLAHHPVWRAVGRLVGTHTAPWQRLRERSLERLRDGNEDPAAFRVTTRYLLTRVDVAG